MKYLVIGPASMGIFSLIGALKRIETNIKDVHEISGCSAGAILTLFLALNIPIDDILDICLNLDLSSVINVSISSFLTSYGFVDMTRVKEKIIEVCGCNPTFNDVEKKIYISAYCLNTHKTEYFSRDTHPDMNIIDAVCMSMAIPVIFESIEYNGYNYVDGCTCEEYPLQPFLDKKDYEVTCITVNINKRFKEEIKNPLDFFESIIFSTFGNKNSYTKNIKIIEINLGDTNIFKFDMDYEEKIRLYILGNNYTTTHQ